LLCWVGVHCTIYRGSYNVLNISYLNSLPPLLSFISPPFLKQFQQVSFLHFYTCIYIICTVFILLALSTSHLPPPSCTDPDPVLWFCRRKNIKGKKRNMTFLLVWNKDSYTGRFLVVPMHICVITPIGSSLPVLFTPP
jgi:hypothetical protein